ncbi:hypothetical protein D9758_006252 [Tetrapyrgos nigripes]|uniref:Uncharacterized protein n=1 Tax=Tetrapyrgos nigripes TaxID=182062 RepID=A0A8H5LLD6_9AGAR|nr:hypothetical protein D9758_006252 [Tetrapyrgos nigripes]
MAAIQCSSRLTSLEDHQAISHSQTSDGDGLCGVLDSQEEQDKDAVAFMSRVRRIVEEGRDSELLEMIGVKGGPAPDSTGLDWNIVSELVDTLELQAALDDMWYQLRLIAEREAKGQSKRDDWITKKFAERAIVVLLRLKEGKVNHDENTTLVTAVPASSVVPSLDLHLPTPAPTPSNTSEASPLSFVHAPTRPSRYDELNCDTLQPSTRNATSSIRPPTLNRRSSSQTQIRSTSAASAPPIAWSGSNPQTKLHLPTPSSILILSSSSNSIMKNTDSFRPPRPSLCRRPSTATGTASSGSISFAREPTRSMSGTPVRAGAGAVGTSGAFVIAAGALGGGGGSLSSTPAEIPTPSARTVGGFVFPEPPHDAGYQRLQTMAAPDKMSRFQMLSRSISLTGSGKRPSSASGVMEETSRPSPTHIMNVKKPKRPSTSQGTTSILSEAGAGHSDGNKEPGISTEMGTSIKQKLKLGMGFIRPSTPTQKAITTTTAAFVTAAGTTTTSSASSSPSTTAFTSPTATHIRSRKTTTETKMRVKQSSSGSGSETTTTDSMMDHSLSVNASERSVWSDESDLEPDMEDDDEEEEEENHLSMSNNNRFSWRDYSRSSNISMSRVSLRFRAGNWRSSFLAISSGSAASASAGGAGVGVSTAMDLGCFNDVSSNSHIDSSMPGSRVGHGYLSSTARPRNRASCSESRLGSPSASRPPSAYMAPPVGARTPIAIPGRVVVPVTAAVPVNRNSITHSHIDTESGLSETDMHMGSTIHLNIQPARPRHPVSIVLSDELRQRRFGQLELDEHVHDHAFGNSNGYNHHHEYGHENDALLEVDEFFEPRRLGKGIGNGNGQGIGAGAGAWLKTPKAKVGKTVKRTKKMMGSLAKGMTSGFGGLRDMKGKEKDKEGRSLVK